ncbi:non-structural maintenance of chromosomes element 3 homolog [Drosophila takahashii]|uniref:non-structural maintenance of chromosomes element 3 homolog n=1 Tax=Drosophila takahashii TaxID=29030 RepID=UPI001CF8C483|nr:melanoma-associated antigen B1 [Drosophila takahashii]
MASTSRAARSQNVSHSQATQQPIREVDDKVRGILAYILDHTAQKIPIKDKDLVPAAGDRNELKKRLPLVAELLAKRFGILLTPLDAASKTFICIAEEPVASIHELTPAQRPQFTLLYIILMYIFLRGNRIEDTKLYGMLEMLNIQDEEHGYFGANPRKQIDETFVKQQYLKRERSQLSAYDDPKTFFLWGPRAKAEFTFEQIVQFASKLLNQHPKIFDHHLTMAQEGVNAEQ